MLVTPVIFQGEGSGVTSDKTSDVTKRDSGQEWALERAHLEFQVL